MASRKQIQPVQQQLTRAALYIRVSTEDQARDGFGLDVQRRKGHSQASIKDWHIVGEYADEGISGVKSAAQRPGLSALLAAIEAKQIDAVIVLSLDRLGRKTRIVLELVEQFTAAGVVLASVKESLDTSTPQGQFVLTMFAALAQLERDMIVQRTTDGRNERGVEDGEKGGQLPYGYMRSDDGPIIDQMEAETVRYILNNKRSGKSYAKIANELNAKGIPSARGRKWYAPAVKIICDNRAIYAGSVRGASAVSWPAMM